MQFLILECGARNPICCRLQQHPALGRAPFEALSYVRGDTKETKDEFCCRPFLPIFDGQVIEVLYIWVSNSIVVEIEYGPNCTYFLYNPKIYTALCPVSLLPLRWQLRIQ